MIFNFKSYINLFRYNPALDLHIPFNPIAQSWNAGVYSGEVGSSASYTPWGDSDQDGSGSQGTSRVSLASILSTLTD